MENYLLRAISTDGSFRAFALTAKDVIAEAQERHDTWSSSTVALGRMMLGGLLMGANLKGNDKYTIKMSGNGNGGLIVVDANAYGDVKGFIQNPHVDLRKTSTGEVYVTQATGNQGVFAVIKDMGLREPYAGQIPFVSGEVAEEFTYYLTESEQTPSSVGLNVHLDDEQRVKLAGGFMVQVLPDANEDTIAKIEKNLQNMPAISQILEKNSAEGLLEAIFGKDEYKVLSKTPVQFKCDCSKEKFARGIISLGKEEIQAMINEDNQAEAVCQFCENKYQYSQTDLEELMKEAK
ncbi:MAG: Hsp33 family molecular chaperone HslO [Streptococcaceae bacterium]|nr:Hsp33 family molecular chaperone HslO [Streptococcaceae bacterium]